MAHVLSLVTFEIDARHREAFLDRAREELRPYWEARGSKRYEVYEEMGPAGPSGRLVEVNLLEDAAADRSMTAHVREAQDLPASAYRWVRKPRFQVMESRL